MAGADSWRVAPFARTMLVFLRIAWVNVAAVAGSIAAIAPMFGRRRPFGTRTGPVAARGARVIPFEPGRRAQNR